jgi:hypothetical protein
MNSSGDNSIRLLTFDPDAGKIYVKTYNPEHDYYRTEYYHQFELDWLYWDYINYPPEVLNPTDQVNLVEDQVQGWLDLDGDARPTTGIFSDPDSPVGDALTFTVFDPVYGWGPNYDNGVINATVSFNGSLQILPYTDQYGSQVLSLNASDMIDGWITHDVTINVASVNDPPVMNITSNWQYFDPLPEDVISNRLTVLEDSLCNLTLTAYDPVEPEDTAGFKFYSNSSPTNAPFFMVDEGTGNVSFLPTNEDVGIYDLMVEVDDGGTVNNRDHFNFTLEVVNTNDAPTITTADITTATEDTPYSVDYDADDIDPTNDKLGWTLDTEADFLFMESDSGILSGTPGNTDVGNYSVTVSVSDRKGGTDSSTFNLSVGDVNDAPFIVTAPLDIFMDEDTVDTSINLYDWFGDVDTISLEFPFSGNDKIDVLVDANGTVALTPEANWSGSEAITFTADDGEYQVSGSVNVTVEPVNDAPIDAKIETVMEPLEGGTRLKLHGEATDVDLPYGDRLSYSWTASTVGELGSAQDIEVTMSGGNYTITLTVTDLKGKSVKEYQDVSIPFIQLPPEDDDIDDDIDDDVNNGTDTNETTEAGMGATTVALIVIVVVLVVIGIIVILVLVMRKKKEPEAKPPEPKATPQDAPSPTPPMQTPAPQEPAQETLPQEGPMAQFPEEQMEMPVQEEEAPSEDILEMEEEPPMDEEAMDDEEDWMSMDDDDMPDMEEEGDINVEQQ